MKHRLESQGVYLSPDTPDEVYERGEDGLLHLVDVDELLNRSGDSGLLEDDNA